jgi:rsbT antagonist protein RsbS
MNTSTESIKITMHETQGCLVVPIQEELSRHAAQQIQEKILKQIHAGSLNGVVIDLSGVQIIDSPLWEVFTNTIRMIKMMGFPSVITGLNPGVVASIIDLNLDFDDIATAMHLEDALEMLTQSTEQETAEEGDADEFEDEDVVEQEIEGEKDLEGR